MRPKQQEVGDLFVTDSIMTVKLLPSRKSASKPIRWFQDGAVTDPRAATRDIAALIGRLQGRQRVVRGLTLMTERGTEIDLEGTGLAKVVARAGFEVLN